MNRPVRSSLFKKRLDFDMPLTEISMPELRRAFAPLFDEAAQAIQIAGYEQDDGVIHRSVVCAIRGQGAHPVEASELSDQDRFASQIVDSLGALTGGVARESDVTVRALEVEAVLERWGG